MSKVKLLVLLQWFVVFSYAKWGYNATGEAAQHWARFFYITNQLILVLWLCAFYYFPKEAKREFHKALWFNICLAVIWGQHYLFGAGNIIERNPYHFCLPILCCIYSCLLLSFLINFRRK
jgi:hypothetical protein